MNEAYSAREPTTTNPSVLSEKEFQLFRSLMLDEAGVTLGASKRALVSGRLSKRLRAKNCAGFADYYKLIREDAKELQVAINLLTTNETYFFREPRHFDFLRDTILPAHTAPREFRVWSAACSSGEEVYSLAMVLAEVQGTRAGPGNTGSWSIMGSDLNTQVLEKARGGHYGLVRIDGIPQRLLKRYCLKGKDDQLGTFLVGRELRERTEFRQINLATSLPAFEPFDLVLLRNVMIYFSQETKLQVLRRVCGQIRPGGYLYIGHSESLNGLDSELDMQFVRPSIYRRR